MIGLGYRFARGIIEIRDWFFNADNFLWLLIMWLIIIVINKIVQKRS